MQKEEREKGQGTEKKTYRTAATQRVGIVAMAAVGTVLIAIVVDKVSISAMLLSPATLWSALASTPPQSTLLHNGHQRMMMLTTLIM